MNSAYILLKDCSNQQPIKDVDAKLPPPTLGERKERNSSIDIPRKRPKFSCHICGRNFTLKENMRRHLRNNSCFYKPTGRKKKSVSRRLEVIPKAGSNNRSAALGKHELSEEKIDDTNFHKDLDEEMRVEMSVRDSVPELFGSLPDVGRSLESICTLPISQEVCPIIVLCPLAKCGKSFSSITNVNWHLRYEHKSGLQLNEAPAVDVMCETTVQDELKHPPKKKHKIDEYYSEDFNSSFSGKEGSETPQEVGIIKSRKKCDARKIANIQEGAIKEAVQDKNQETREENECNSILQTSFDKPPVLTPTCKKGKQKGRGSFPCPKCRSVFTLDQSMKYHLKNNSCFKKRGNPRLIKNPKFVNCEVEDSAKTAAANNRNIHVNGTGIEFPAQGFEETSTTRKSLEETHQISAEKIPELVDSERMKDRCSIRGNMEAWVNYLSRHLKDSHSRIILFRVDEAANRSSLDLPEISDKFKPDLSEIVQAENLRPQETEENMQIDRNEEVFSSLVAQNKPKTQDLHKKIDEEKNVEKIPEESEPGIKRSNKEDVRGFTKSVAEPELAKVQTSENEESVGRLSLPKKKLPYLTLSYPDGSLLEESSISKRKQTTATSTDKKHSSRHQKRSKEKRLRKEALTCSICEKFLAPEMNLRLHMEWHRRKGELEDGLDEVNYEETKEVVTNEEDKLLDV